MSQMSNLQIEIQEMLENNIHPDTIAKLLDIPISLVYDAMEATLELEQDAFSPFHTINS